MDTPETVAPGQPVGCYGKEASTYTKRELNNRLIRLEIPRIGNSEDAYGRTLAYVYLDPDKNGTYEHSFNEDLIILGLARTTTFSHTYRFLTPTAASSSGCAKKPRSAEWDCGVHAPT